VPTKVTVPLSEYLAAKFKEVLTIEPANLDAIGFLEPFLRQTRKFQELREMLLAAGQPNAATQHLKRATESPDAGIRRAAGDLLARP